MCSLYRFSHTLKPDVAKPSFARNRSFDIDILAIFSHLDVLLCHVLHDLVDIWPVLCLESDRCYECVFIIIDVGIPAILRRFSSPG